MLHIIGGLVYIFIIGGFIGRMRDSGLKLFLTLACSIGAIILFSKPIYITCIGAFIMMTLGRPVDGNVVNISQIRREYGTMFDFIGTALVLLGIILGVIGFFF